MQLQQWELVLYFSTYARPCPEEWTQVDPEAEVAVPAAESQCWMCVDIDKNEL